MVDKPQFIEIIDFEKQTVKQEKEIIITFNLTTFRIYTFIIFSFGLMIGLIIF